MPRHLISDAHEWSNEVPTVPIYLVMKAQPRERAWYLYAWKEALVELNSNLVVLCA